jgi:AcrR family transcriptional regulator
MVVEPLTPERRRQQTRDALVSAATRVFAERGFHGASLDDVAAVAGFTKGAVYSNFSGKDELFLAVLESRYEDNFAKLQAALAAAEDRPDEVSDWVDYVRRQYTEDEELWSALHQEFTAYALRHPEARERLAALQRADVEGTARVIAAERQLRGLAMPEPPEHQAAIVVALFRGLFEMRVIDHDAVDESLLESVLSFVTRAMTPPA